MDISNPEKLLKGVNSIFNQANPDTESFLAALGSPEDLMSILKTSASDGIDMNSLQSRKIKYGTNTLTLWLTAKPLLYHFVSYPILHNSLLLAIISTASNYFFKEFLTFSQLFSAFIAIFLISSLNFTLDLYITCLMNQIRCQSMFIVTRNRKKCRFFYHDLVVGDIIHLKSGCIVPADIFIIKSKELSVNDSFYTGQVNNSEYKGIIIKSNSEILTGKLTGLVLAVGKNRVSYRVSGNNEFFETGIEMQEWFIEKLKKSEKFFCIFFIFWTILNVLLTKEGQIAKSESKILNDVLLFFVILLMFASDICRKIPFLVYARGFSHYKDLAVKMNVENFSKLSQIRTVCIDLSSLSSSEESKIQSLSISNHLSLEMSDLYKVSNANIESIITSFSIITQIQYQKNPVLDQTVLSMQDLLNKLNPKKSQIFFSLKHYFYHESKKLFIFVTEASRKISIHVYGPYKTLIKFCDKFENSEGNLLNFSLSDKSRALTEFAEFKEKNGQRVIGIAYKTLTLQEYLLSIGETGQINLDQCLESLNLLCGLGINIPISSSLIKDIQMYHKSSLNIKILTEDNIKSATFIASKCKLLPNKYKLTFEDKWVISGKDLLIITNIMNNSPNNITKQHEINKRLANIKLLAEANSEQKGIFLSKIQELNGKFAVFKGLNPDYHEFVFEIKDLKDFYLATQWSTFALYMGKWFLEVFIELGCTVTLFIILHRFSDTVSEVEALFEIFGFFMMMILFCVILFGLRVENLEKFDNCEEMWKFSYFLGVFRAFFNVFVVFGLVKLDFKYFGENLLGDLEGASNRVVGISTNRCLVYFGLFSLCLNFRNWKNNQLLRVSIGVISFIISEVLFNCYKVDESLTETNKKLCISCILVLYFRNVFESLLVNLLNKQITNQ